MQTKVSDPPLSAEALERKHESRNPRASAILFVAALVVITMLICAATVWLMIGALERKRPLDRSVSARGVITTPSPQFFERFPSPNLQLSPHEDLKALRAREDAELNGYGWVDRSNRIARIPVQRAMDLIAQNGLPAFGSKRPGASPYQLIRERSQER